MSGIPPLRSIAATQERELLARSLEMYGNAVVTQMLPALQLGSDQLSDMANQEGSSPDVDISSAFYMDTPCDPEFDTDAPFGSEFDCTLLDVGWYARMELALVRYHALGFVFVAIYHLFERQLATVLFGGIIGIGEPFSEIGSNRNRRILRT